MISSPVSASGDRILDNALRKSSGLISLSHGLAVALEQLGDLDLPPEMHSPVDQAKLRAIASLYLASDLENAGVLPAVEQLSGLSTGGGVPIDLGHIEPLLADFWRHRHERATPEERRQTFQRLFGGQFEELMLDLCEALYKLDELATNARYGGVQQQMRVRSAALRLIESVVDDGGGITVFLAQEIMKSLKAALAILGHPDAKGQFGARDVWGVVTGIDRLTKNRRGDPRLFVRRGRAGMTVLSWLADVAPSTGGVSENFVGLDNPVIPVAADWIESALAIGEADAPQGTPVRAATTAALISATGPAA
jgi:hypothetical protein